LIVGLWLAGADDQQRGENEQRDAVGAPQSSSLVEDSEVLLMAFQW
jgi:hypothetical protein